MSVRRKRPSRVFGMPAVEIRLTCCTLVLAAVTTPRAKLAQHQEQEEKDEGGGAAESEPHEAATAPDASFAQDKTFYQNTGRVPGALGNHGLIPLR